MPRTHVPTKRPGAHFRRAPFLGAAVFTCRNFRLSFSRTQVSGWEPWLQTQCAWSQVKCWPRASAHAAASFVFKFHEHDFLEGRPDIEILKTSRLHCSTRRAMRGGTCQLPIRSPRPGKARKGRACTAGKHGKPVAKHVKMRLRQVA